MKKVILYNTTVSAILNSNEQFIKKLRHVLDTFKNRDDVVLWWRPHPLSISTYESMRPKLMEEYMQIVDDYKREGYGIYDNTPDLHRAIAWTDAYYGDQSSIIPLYQATGKPVMLQNAYLHPDNPVFSSLQFENMYDDGEYLWFTAYYFNALFKMDKQAWKVEYIGSFPGEDAAGHRLYRDVTECEGKLCFAPGTAKGIGVYDINTGRIESVALNHIGNVKDEISASDIKFICAAKYESKVFFAGASYPAILSYDVISGQICIYNDWVEKLNQLGIKHEILFFTQGTVIGKTLLLPLYSNDAVVEFDMDECTSMVHELYSNSKGFVSVHVIRESVWLIPRIGGEIINWNRQINKIIKRDIQNVVCEYLGVDCVTTKQSYWRTVRYNDDIYIFPCWSNRAVKINTRTGEISDAAMFQPECDIVYSPAESSLFCAYIATITDGNKIYAKTGRSNTFIEYNFETGERREKHIKPPDNISDIFKELHRYTAHSYFYEKYFTDFERFILYVKSISADTVVGDIQQQVLDARIDNSGKTSGTVGNSIYVAVKM